MRTWAKSLVALFASLTIVSGVYAAADFGNTTVISPTDASNNSGTQPSWAEGMAPSTVNDAARALQGAIARWWLRSQPAIASTGSANAYVLTHTVAPAALYNGARVCFEANFANTGTATLNENSLGAKTIQKEVNGTLTNLAANDIRSGQHVCATYDTSSTVYVMESPLGNSPYAGGGTDVALADGGTGASLSDPNDDRYLMWDDSAGAVIMGNLGSSMTTDSSGNLHNIESFCVAASDETTTITTGTDKIHWRMPYAFTITGIRGSLTGPSTSGTFTADVHEGGTTIMATNKLVFDANEETTTTAATAPTVSDTSLANDAEMSIDVDDDGTSAEGLKVCLIGYQT